MAHTPHSTCKGWAGCCHEKGELLFFITRVEASPHSRYSGSVLGQTRVMPQPMPTLLYHYSSLIVHILAIATRLSHSVESPSTPLLGACPPVQGVLRLML